VSDKPENQPWERPVSAQASLSASRNVTSPAPGAAPVESLKDLTVLATQRDPFRMDTPAGRGYRQP
jgi:hypothetical protein